MRVEDVLGFARRAGRLAVGAGPVERAVARRQAKALVIATDASMRARRHARRYADQRRIPLLEWGTKASLGAALGKSEVGIAAVLDDRFALTLSEALKGSVGDEKGLR